MLYFFLTRAPFIERRKGSVKFLFEFILCSTLANLVSSIMFYLISSLDGSDDSLNALCLGMSPAIIQYISFQANLDPEAEADLCGNNIKVTSLAKIYAILFFVYWPDTVFGLIFCYWLGSLQAQGYLSCIELSDFTADNWARGLSFAWMTTIKNFIPTSDVERGTIPMYNPPIQSDVDDAFLPFRGQGHRLGS
mmetsp:Transcript_28775/g.51198  ORF Transcript_28775/g.51198 Transcript_28775/m.51198 type:complete len:193 (-) Transcript_28775:65-643(-)